MPQYALVVVIAPVGVDVFLKHDLVTRERSRLVSAQYVHRSEILYGVKILHNGFLARHGHGSFRKIGGDYHRKHFRGETHRHGNGKDECLQPVAFRESVHEKHERNHHKHEAYEQKAHPADALIESRCRTVAGDAFDNRAHISVVAGCEHYSGCGAADHIRAEETDVVEFGQPLIGRHAFQCMRMFFYRVRFSRERCLAHKQVFCLNDAHIGRYHVACRNHHDVARHEVGYVDLLIMITHTPDIAGIGYHPEQRLARCSGLPFLSELENGARNNHDRNDDDCCPVLLTRIGSEHIKDKRHHHKNREHADERIDESLYESGKGILLLFVLHLVAPEDSPSALDLFGTQSYPGRLKKTVNRDKRLRRCHEYPRGIVSKNQVAFSFLPHRSILLSG